MASRELDCVALESSEGPDVHEQFSPTSSSLSSESSSSESSSTSISRPVHTVTVSVSLWPSLPVDVSNILVNAGMERPEQRGFACENEDELDAFIPGVDKTALAQVWSEAVRAAYVGVRREARISRQQLSTSFTITSHPPVSSWFGASFSHQSGCRRKTCVLSPSPKLSCCSAVAKSPSREDCETQSH